MFEPLSELCIDIERPWDFLIRLLLGERFCWSTEMHKRNDYYHDIEFPTRVFLCDEWKSTDLWLIFRGWTFFCVSLKLTENFPFLWWFKSTWGWVCLRKIRIKRKWGKIMRFCEAIRATFYEYTWYAKLSSHEEMRNILWADAFNNFVGYADLFYVMAWKKVWNINYLSFNMNCI